MLFGIFVIKPDILAGWKKALGMKVAEPIASNYTNSRTTNQNPTTTEKDDEVENRKSIRLKPSDVEMESNLSTEKLATPNETS